MIPTPPTEMTREEQCIQDPLSVIQELFTQYRSTMKSNDPFEDVDYGSDAVFDAIWDQPTLCTQCPSLHQQPMSSIPSGNLVHFRGFIQDVCNPEFYAGVLQHATTGQCIYTKGRKSVIENIDAWNTVGMFERTPVLATDIPYCSPAYCNLWQLYRTGDSEQRAEDPSRMGKRKRNGTESEGMAMEDGGDMPRLQVPATDAAAESASLNPAAPTVAPSQPTAPVDEHRASLRLLYYGHGSAPKFGSLVEVLGVLTLPGAEDKDKDKETVSQSASEAEMDMDAFFSNAESYGSLPTLHVLSAREASLMPLTPLTPWPVQGSSLDASLPLALHLGGDTLLAQLVLIALTSSVWQRSPTGPIGAFPLNIVLPPPSAIGKEQEQEQTANVPGAAALSTALVTVLQVLCPAVFHCPLTLSLLNGPSLATTQSVESGRLQPSPLLLAPGSCMLLDETALQAGTVSEAGMRNIQIISDMLLGQVNTVEVPYNSLKMPTSIQVVSVSNGRSVLRQGMQACLWQGEMTTQSGSLPSLDGVKAAVDAARIAAAKMSISPEVADRVQSDFVSERQRQGSAATVGYDSPADALHSWIVMAKCWSALQSPQSETLSWEMYQAVRDIDRQRVSRFPVGTFPSS